MTDTYQPIFDAVRTSLRNTDVGAAIEHAITQANVSHYADMARQAIVQAAAEFERPSVLFRPKLSADGTMWCALLGDDLQSGIAGFGETPAKAMYAFDQAFWKEKTPAVYLAEEAEQERKDNGQFGVGA